MLPVNELRELRGRGTELITLYVPPGKVPDATALLRDEVGKSSNIKSSVTKHAVQAALRSTIDRLKGVSRDQSVMVVVGETSIGWISEVIETPKPVSSIIYRCGSTFFLDPIERMEDKGKAYGIICIDLHEVAVVVIRGTHLETVLSDESNVPNKQSRGGQSAKRFGANREIAIRAWYRDTANKINEVLVAEELEGIILSGPGLTKNDFGEESYLHYELRKKIIGIVDTGYAGGQGVRETLQNGQDLLAESELIKQRVLMDRFLRGLARGDGVSYGRNQVLHDLENGRCDTILITRDDKDIKTICERMGTTYAIVNNEFEEGRQLEVVFGGLGAINRY